MKNAGLLVSFMLGALIGNGQDRPDVSRLADDLLGFQDRDVNYEELYENLMLLQSHPLDLNTVPEEDLRMLFMLSENQIHQFLEYRKIYGPLLSTYELQAIPDFDAGLIQKLLPFVVVSTEESSLNKSLLKRMTRAGNMYIVTRYEKTLEEKQGYDHPDAGKRYKGTADKWYTRFRHSMPGDFSIGFTAEKDAGEHVSIDPSSPTFGLDYYSFHAQVQNKGRLKNLIAGDFQSQFGQGLLFGSAFGLGKGGETVSTARKPNSGLLPYTSANESGFYRGIGITLEALNNVHVTAFYSRVKRDGAVSDTELNGTTISALHSTGFHRNEFELGNKKIITEENYGAVINLRRKKLDTGIILQGTCFSNPIDKAPSTFNQFAFQGAMQQNAAVFFNYSHHNFNFFGEAAKSFHGGSATVAGCLASLHPDFDLSVVFRKYDNDFYTFYGNAFSENTQPQNETGLYWGWKYHFKPRLNVAGYTDLFKFPWITFRRYAPSSGYEWLLRLNYEPTRKISMFAQVREESKSRNVNSSEATYQLMPGRKRNYCLNLDYDVHENIGFRTRVQYSSYSIASGITDGVVILQDIRFTIGKFQLIGRHALFHTDDFDNRQYVYENDVWLAYSLPAYHGIGIKNFVLVEYAVNKKLSFWLKYSRIRYTDRDEIGSGLETIAGNIKNDIKAQMMWRF